ncbi:hypothetical protein J5Y03_04720 [Bacillus sp. RG28]|uniref:Uncharacterized protein n=1 Tax=Gottfriedia endophytica TaxID=2820819 RepID=A0A940NL17_9BACI|nr:hypothetical protein [Gottfriedia endophytica]MBP0724491.1 hypothetical protein [Gottfriedia endophytica]
MCIQQLKLRKNNEGFFLPFTLLLSSMLVLFFLIQISIFQSYNLFEHKKEGMAEIERGYSYAIYKFRQFGIPENQNDVILYGNTKIMSTFNMINQNQYLITLNANNYLVNKHMVQFELNVLTGDISSWKEK